MQVFKKMQWSRTVACALAIACAVLSAGLASQVHAQPAAAAAGKEA